MSEYVEINPSVQKAILNKEPVVALESTIISHGMPYPQNVETAQKVEDIVSENGALPATIAIMNGKIKVGLSEDEIDHLGKKGSEVIKASRRDIPYLISSKLDGATTVASTMIGARMAGINIFATGGIGGVHRGATETMDISADLQELAKTNVAVVCAGAKAILDLGLTLEYLETHGVPVIGYQTSELPAFYTRESGFNVDYQLDTPTQIGQFLKAKWQMKLDGGVVIANPVPKEYNMDSKTIMKVIDQAVKESTKLGIKGKESTPFLLKRIKELTDGKSLVSNIELVLNNAKLAADIAHEYAKSVSFSA